MRLPIVHHPGFQAEIEPGHRFPMGKYGEIARLLAEQGMVAEGGFRVPEPVDAGTATLAHSPGYANQVLRAEVDPAIAREIGFAVTPGVSMRARLSSGATILAAKLALEGGIATSAAGGSHHARRERGAGFCVFNDVAIATAHLLKENRIGSVLVFDCDVHQGDGTAEILSAVGGARTVSIHAEKNYPVRKVASDIDVGLADGTGDEAYLEALADTLKRSVGLITPDIVFYNAGVDPHAEDRLGRLALTDRGLEERDRRVIGFFRDRRVPVACVQGGGYSRDPLEVARRHVIVHRVAAEFT